MTNPMKFLLTHSELSHAQLAEKINAVGAAFGGTRESLAGTRFKRMADGKQSAPKWVRLAAFKMAVDSGWPIETVDELKFAIRSFRLLNKNAEFDLFMNSLSNNLRTTDELERLWRADVMAHPED